MIRHIPTSSLSTNPPRDNFHINFKKNIVWYIIVSLTAEVCTDLIYCSKYIGKHKQKSAIKRKEN